MSADLSNFPNLLDESTYQTFDLTIHSDTNGNTRNWTITTQQLPIAMASSWQTCDQSSAKPTSSMLTNANSVISQLNQIPAQITSETYEDQIGIYTALIHWANEQQSRARQYANLWWGYHMTCYKRHRSIFGVCTWCCNNHPKNAQDANTCKSSRNELIQYATQTNNIVGLWDDFMNPNLGGLLAQQQTMLDGMSNYNLNQTMQAEFTGLLAQVNEQIATSNAVIQQTELQLLKLKKEELAMKASYIVGPLLIIIGIALVYND